MPRIRPFHDSMRLFVAGIGVARPLVGSRNVNRWFSRDTFADHASGSDEALAPVGDGAVRVRALPVKERVARLPPLAVGGGPCGRGIRVRHAAQGDGDLPQLLACPGPWLDPGGLGDIHAHAEQAPPHLGIRPALAQRLRNATAPVDRHRQWRGDPGYGMSPRGGGFALGDVPADHMPRMRSPSTRPHPDASEHRPDAPRHTPRRPAEPAATGPMTTRSSGAACAPGSHVRPGSAWTTTGAATSPDPPLAGHSRATAGCRGRDPCTASASCRPRSFRSSSSWCGIRDTGEFPYPPDNHVQTLLTPAAIRRPNRFQTHILADLESPPPSHSNTSNPLQHKASETIPDTHLGQ